MRWQRCHTVAACTLAFLGVCFFWRFSAVPTHACTARAVAGNPGVCWATRHVVFVVRDEHINLGSTIMRAHVTAAAINATGEEVRQAKGISPDTQLPAAHVVREADLPAHFAAHGPATACVIVKSLALQPGLVSVPLCRKHGAVLLWDLIDLEDAWDIWSLRIPDVDFHITLSDQQTRWLEERGMPGVLIPHGHSNLDEWSAARSTRPARLPVARAHSCAARSGHARPPQKGER